MGRAMRPIPDHAVPYQPGYRDGYPYPRACVTDRLGSLGWQAAISLEQGLTETHRCFLGTQVQISL